MSPIEWLCAQAPGFNELSSEEREAIMQFTLLWSLFEDKALDNNATINAILKLVQRWENSNQLENAVFNEGLTYFSERYFSNGEATVHFNGLRLRNKVDRALVEAGLRDESENPRDRVIALFIVIYRLRNNLVHGEKWADGIRGQLGNFTNANGCLMAAIDLETHSD